MEKKGKRTGVSRRDFLKGLGGGAVGTAIVSAGLLKPDRVEASAHDKEVPFHRASDHFGKIEEYLHSLLKGIQGVTASPAQVLWVSCRLNRREGMEAPVFVGWVESDVAKTKRGTRYPHPMDTRLGDTHVSTLYKECLRAPLKTVVKRAWNGEGADATSQELGRKYYEETHRRSMPIKLGNRYVGTVNAAFSGDPGSSDPKIARVLEDWAQTETRGLVRYIQKLNVRGLPHPV